MESRSKVKRLVVLIVLLFAAATGKAQTWGEVFNQKKTQKKYLLEQIAALQVYIGYAKKGYDIAGSGIGTIRDIKNGEFGLHSAFFSSLKAVSPAIRNNSRVAEIVVLQLAISKSFNGIRSTGFLSPAHAGYIASVRKKVLEECAADLEELLLVITSGRVEMTDEERIRRLDKVYTAMQDKSAFTQMFTGEVALLIAQKAGEQKGIGTTKKIYGITQ